FRLLHVLHENAGGRALEEVDRQRQQACEGSRGDADVDLVRGEQQQVALEEGEGGIEQDGERDADRQNVERRVGVVHEHLVEDNLDENRYRKREQVQGQCGGEDVAEDPSLAQKLGDEPPKTKGLPLIGEAMHPLEEDRRSAPASAEGLLIEKDGS